MDWSELNSDLLCLVAKKLGDISNFVRFRAVCTLWRSAVLPSHLPPQLPWFAARKLSQEMKFYSFNLNKTYRVLQDPEVDMKSSVGASNEYLLLADDYDSVFVNPLVGSQIQVPYECCSIDDLRAIHSCNNGSNPIEGSICAAMFWSEEVGNKDILWLIWLSKNGDWTKVEVPELSYEDPAAFYKGKLFASDCETEVTRVVDITNGNVVSVILGQGIDFDYLIEAFDDLLGVVQLFNSDDEYDLPIEECRFKVYRLEHSDNNTYSWTEMSRGIGDLMLFLDFA